MLFNYNVARDTNPKLHSLMVIVSSIWYSRDGLFFGKRSLYINSLFDVMFDNIKPQQSLEQSERKTSFRISPETLPGKKR